MSYHLESLETPVSHSPEHQISLRYFLPCCLVCSLSHKPRTLLMGNSYHLQQALSLEPRVTGKELQDRAHPHRLLVQSLLRDFTLSSDLREEKPMTEGRWRRMKSPRGRAGKRRGTLDGGLPEYSQSCILQQGHHLTVTESTQCKGNQASLPGCLCSLRDLIMGQDVSFTLVPSRVLVVPSLWSFLKDT